MDLKTALKELAEQITAEVHRLMESGIGYNEMAKKNTLVGSELYKSVKTVVEDDNTLAFQIASYYTYVVGGWTKSGKGGGTLQGFIDNIENWLVRKGLREKYEPTDIVWAIYNRAKKMHYGIQPRPFLGNGYKNPDPEYVLPFLYKFWEKWADNIFEEITKSIDNRF